MKLNNREKLIVIVIIAISALFFSQLLSKDYKGPDYLPDPIQKNLSSKQYLELETKAGNIKVELVASYEVHAGVRGRKNYSSDYPSRISPMDLILAWGDLNQPKLIETVKFRQSGRWYYYNLNPDAPVTVSHVGQHSSNTHIIPANDEVLKKLKTVKENSVVLISGYLVNVIFENGPWSTSLSRTDTGDGACEILLVETITVN